MVQLVTSSQLVATWERVYGFSSVRRSIAIFSLARPEVTLNQLLALTIGERDSALLDLREHLFGSRIQSIAACPQCNDKSELNFSVSDIRLPPGSKPVSICVELDQRTITARPLTCADLLAVETIPRWTRRDALMLRCLESPVAEEEPFSETAQKALVEKLAEADPQADIRIGVNCAKCGHAWSAIFDIASHLWAEIDAWAQRLMTEVHALASAYGWSERDIVAMSAWRRQLYMGMLRR